MGLWHWLFGPPDRGRFAQRVIAALRRAGEARPIQFDAAEFQLVIGTEPRTTMFLGNVYAEYCAAPRLRRRALLVHFIRAVARGEERLPETWDAARPNVLPAVRERVYFEFLRLRSDAGGRPVPSWPHRPFADHLALALVYDTPDAIVMVNDDHLAHWGVSFDAAQAAARATLRRRSPGRFKSPLPGLFVSPWQDNHDASRLLLPDLLCEYEVKGDLVAMIPNRDALILTGSADLAGLGAMVKLAREALGGPRPMSGRALRLDNNRWVSYLPEPAHPLHADFRLLLLQSVVRDYEEQRELLEALHARTGQTVFVPHVNPMQDPRTGRLFTFGTWLGDNPTLLPRADYVSFLQFASSAQGNVVAVVPWERVQAVMGEQMSPTDCYPERFRVESFPTPEQFEAMQEGGPEE